MKKLSIKKKIMIWFTVALLILALGTSAFTMYISRNVLNQSIQERLINLVSSNAEEIEFYNSLDGREREASDFFLSYKNLFLTGFKSRTNIIGLSYLKYYLRFSTKDTFLTVLHLYNPVHKISNLKYIAHQS